MEIPKSHYVYEFAYPQEMPELAGIIFYVGKGTSLSRMNDHFREAASEKCDCAKCEAIRSVWAAGLAVVRKIVFTSGDEKITLDEESRRIIRHRSPYLTNVQHNRLIAKRSLPSKAALNKQDSIDYVSHLWEVFYQNKLQENAVISLRNALDSFFASLIPETLKRYSVELAALECDVLIDVYEGLLEPA
jgi:hypothetical protein